jgi:hypothetical protein
MARNNQRGSRSNSSNSRDRSNGGVVEAARDNPIKAAVTAAAAVGAGVFLWSRRNQISDQIGQLGDQISDWRDSMGSDPAFESADTGFSSNDEMSSAGKSGGRSGRKSQQQFAEEALSLKETGSAGGGNI